MWIYDIARQNRTRFTFDPGTEQNPVWSPDGGAVIFRSVRSGGRFDLYRKTVGGSDEQELLLESDVAKIPTSWSPDGKLLAFHTDGDIWVLPLEGEKEPYAFTQTDHFISRSSAMLYTAGGELDGGARTVRGQTSPLTRILATARLRPLPQWGRRNPPLVVRK